MTIRAHHLRNQRGVAAPMAAVAMMAIVGLSALGIETGRLALTGNEAQNAADAAATTAARALLDDGNPRTEALAVLARNSINGEAVSSSHLVGLEIGNYSAELGFVSNLVPNNAVRATVGYEVNNLLAGAVGMPTSHVTKTAIATFQGIVTGTPTLPIVIGDCLFDDLCLDEICLPHLGVVPSPIDNSAWTGFFDGGNLNSVRDYFPPECGGEGKSAELSKGDFINVTNGDLNPLFDAVSCMVDQGMVQHTVAIVSCNLNFNQEKEVLGFATVEIDSVRDTGFNQGITLHGVIETLEPPVGGENFGTGAVVLVG